MMFDDSISFTTPSKRPAVQSPFDAVIMITRVIRCSELQQASVMTSCFSIQIIPPRKFRSPTFAIPATIQSTSCLKCNEKEVQVIEGKILINDVSNWYLWNRRRCCHLPRLLRKAYVCLTWRCLTEPSSLQLLSNILLFSLLLMMLLWWQESFSVSNYGLDLQKWILIRLSWIIIFMIEAWSIQMLKISFFNNGIEQFDELKWLIFKIVSSIDFWISTNRFIF